MSERKSQPAGEGAAGYNMAYVGVCGIRFVPTDQELILEYLQPKLRGEPLPTDSVNDNDDVYSEHPKDLVRKLRKSFEGNWYLFSPRGRKYAGGERPRRGTGDGVGFWKSMGAKQQVLGADGKEVIGHKCGLTFHLYVDEPGDDKPAAAGRPRRKRKWKPTEWKMMEFVSINTDRPPDETAANPMLLNDYVVCKITNKKSLEVEVEDPSLSESTEEEQGAPSDGSGASLEQQQQSTSTSEGPSGLQDEQLQATPEAPNGEDTAAAASLQEAEPDDIDLGAKVQDDDQEQWSDSEPLNWTDFLNTNMPGIFDFDDQIGTVDVGGEPEDDKQPAEHMQARSGGGDGSYFPF